MSTLEELGIVATFPAAASGFDIHGSALFPYLDVVYTDGTSVFSQLMTLDEETPLFTPGAIGVAAAGTLSNLHSTSLTNGDFISVWSTNSGIFGTLLDSSGQPIAGKTNMQLSTLTGSHNGSVENAHVAATSDGGFEIYINDFSNFNTLLTIPGAPAQKEMQDAYVRKFDANGNALGPETRLGPTDVDHLAGQQHRLHGALLSNGNNAVVYYDSHVTGVTDGAADYDSEIALELLNPSGTAIAGPITVDQTAGTHVVQNTDSTAPRDVALTNGRTLVSWYATDNGVLDLYASVLGPSGSVLVSPFVVDTLGALTTDTSVILASTPDGGFIISYTKAVNATTQDVFAASFDTNGNPVQAAFDITNGGSGDQTANTISKTFDGRYIISVDDATNHLDSYDYVPANAGDFVQTGTAGNNAIAGTAGAGHENWIDGGAGNDTITGGAGSNDLLGNAGDDMLHDGGASTMFGGTGNDTYFVTNAADTVIEYAGEGNDTVETSLATYLLPANVENLVGTVNTAQSFTGNGLFNTITLGSGNDHVQAGSGGAYITGNGGNDTLIGGAGGGIGGLGNTIYALGGSDFLQGGAGSPSDVLVATGAGQDSFYGGSGNNYIVGGTGRNTIVGGGGALQSLYGNGSGSGANGDYIVGGTSATASNVLVENGTGSASLWGGAGTNYEVGGGGADLLVGGGKSDYQFGGAGDDVIYGGSGTDFIYPGAGNDFIWTDNVGATQSTDYIYEGLGTGVDTVADFTPGDVANHDVLVLPASGTSVTTFAQVQAHTTQVGVYSVVSLSATDQIYLYNVQPFQLTANDFLFL